MLRYVEGEGKVLEREKEMKDESTSRKKLNFVIRVLFWICYHAMCVVRAVIALCTVSTEHKFMNSSLLTGSHFNTKTTMTIIIAFVFESCSL